MWITFHDIDRYHFTPEGIQFHHNFHQLTTKRNQNNMKLKIRKRPILSLSYNFNDYTIKIVCFIFKQFILETIKINTGLFQKLSKVQKTNKLKNTIMYLLLI